MGYYEYDRGSPESHSSQTDHPEFGYPGRPDSDCLHRASDIPYGKPFFLATQFLEIALPVTISFHPSDNYRQPQKF